MDHSDKDHVGSGLDGPPQGLGHRVLQKFASFMHSATHPGPAPEPVEDAKPPRPETLRRPS